MVQYDHNDIMSPWCDGEDCFQNLMNWSIIRPTCYSLESSQLVGPLLTNDSLRAQYVEHVKDFVDNVANEEFFKVVEIHLAALKDLVAEDPWGDYAPLFESVEMAEGESWIIEYPPGVAFLPALRARISGVREQLKALEAGTYPRSSIEEYNKGETCVDWTTESAPDFACPNNCFYEGCGGGVAEIPMCDPQNNTCFSVEYGFSGCIDVPDGELVPGGDGSAFCLSNEGSPIKVTPCPPYEDAPLELVEAPTTTEHNEKGGNGKKNDKQKKRAVKQAARAHAVHTDLRPVVGAGQGTDVGTQLPPMPASSVLGLLLDHLNTVLLIIILVTMCAFGCLVYSRARAQDGLKVKHLEDEINDM